MRSRAQFAAFGATIAFGTLSLVAACARDAAPPAAAATAVGTAQPEVPSPRDSAATLAWFEQRVAAIERDTIAMDKTQKPMSLGAGAAGLVTAWRAGPVWRRLRVEGNGAGFRSVDDYWLSNGVFLGARLEIIRPGRRAAVDQLWFRDRALYRWTDPSGRHLNPDARSTQYEVRTMRARLDSLIRLVSADDAIRKPLR